MSELLQTDDDGAAIGALVSDLHWQINQLAPRGIKDNSGNPYNPSYYKRGLKNAEQRGGVAVVDYIRRYVYKPPSNGYKKLEQADSLDLACEALVADAGKSYRGLFSDEDRAAANARLAPHIEAIEARKAATQARIDERLERLTGDLSDLRAQAEQATDPEVAIAVNTAILRQATTDVVALIRLGRAYDELGAIDRARESFQHVLTIDPDNRIADRRLNDIDRRGR
jgi:tetratricopeptide (TPR) repeat protein